MRIWLRVFGLAVGVALGVWLWRALFPSAETVIRTRLREIKELVSFPPNEKPFTALTAVQQLCARLSPDIEVVVDAPGFGRQRIQGRDEVREKALAFRSQANGAQVDFLDVSVTVAPDKQAATVSLTVKARLASDPDPAYQEMKLTFRKRDGKWLLARAETVQVLR